MLSATENQPNAEAHIPFQEVPHLPWMRRRGGKPLNQSTLWRWQHRGIKHPVTGERIKLRALRVGGICCTTEAWLHEFFEALSGEGHPPQNPSESRSRRQSVEAAEREVKRRGI